MKLEGILIHKTPYKERDLIVQLLTRKGQKTSLYIYGGQGGGKSNKGSSLQLGFMLGFLARDKKHDTKVAKVDQVLWGAKYFPSDYKAFLISQFFLELMHKVALEDEHDDQYVEHEGLFNVLSNALFYLDQAVGSGSIDYMTHIQLFLTKLSYHLGITPDLDHCSFCSKEFVRDEICLMDMQNGGFVCHDCTSKVDEFLSDNMALQRQFLEGKEHRNVLKHFSSIQYKQYGQARKTDRSGVEASFNYLNYQFGFNASDFRSWKLLFE